jgi:hypothetical protein
MKLYGKEAGGYNFEVKFSLDHYYKKYKCTMILTVIVNWLHSGKGQGIKINFHIVN